MTEANMQQLESRYLLVRKVFFAVAAAIWCYRYWNFALLHQLGNPVLVAPGADNTFWLLHLLNVPQFIAGDTLIALVFDLGWLTLAVAAFIDHKRSIWPVVFSVLTLIYFVTFHSYFGHHGHSLVGLLLFSILFWFQPGKVFGLLWEGARYYVCYLYVSAALYKLVRGSAFIPEQFSTVLQVQNNWLLGEETSDWREPIMAFFAHNPGEAFTIAMMAVAAQLAFAAGFFTRKYDRLLVGLGVVFHVGTWLLMDINFWELWVIYLPLLFRFEQLQPVATTSP